MSEELSNKAIRQHAELVADLLRLGIPDGGKSSYRMRELWFMIHDLESNFPELERRRITLMIPKDIKQGA